MKRTKYARAKEKLYQHFRESPELSRMLLEFPKIQLCPLFLTKKTRKLEYYWFGNHNTVSVSMGKKTLDILPKDPGEQKFLFSHELGHLQQTSQEFRQYQNCKIYQRSPSLEADICLFAEVMASQRGCAILKRLNLLSPAEETAFWQWELELDNEEHDLDECRKALKTKTCPLQKELRAILAKAKKLSSPNGGFY